MRVIKFVPLTIHDSRVYVCWTVEPATPLYRQTHFTLDFEGILDPRALPLKLWWTVALLCMHTQWNLLCPCRIILPFRLPEGEIEFWQRQLDLQRASWEIFRGTTDFERRIEIVGEGELLDGGMLPPAGDGFATAFSGGKESLLQTSLLCELTTRPLLVNVQSEMPPLHDHSTRKRAYVLQEITRRRDCQVVEVKSDFRSAWDNLFSLQQGYRQTLNEFSDEPFYAACLLAVAAARGIRHICLGSEFEAHHGSVEHQEGCVNYYQTMSPACIASFDAYFQQWGIRFGTLLLPLSHLLVEKLLWTRYGDVADLQNSCFEMQNANESYCSRCRKCLRIAAILLMLGIDPARLEIDVNKLFPLHAEWNPNWPPIAGAVAYAAQHIQPPRVRPFFPAENFWQSVGLKEPIGYRALKKMVARYHDANEDWVGLYQGRLAKYIPASLRERLDAIYREYAPADSTDRSDEIARLDATIKWLVEPVVKP